MVEWYSKGTMVEEPRQSENAIVGQTRTTPFLSSRERQVSNARRRECLTGFERTAAGMPLSLVPR